MNEGIQFLRAYQVESDAESRLEAFLDLAPRLAHVYLLGKHSFQRGHADIVEPAGVDPGERGQIGDHVQRQAVHGATDGGHGDAVDATVERTDLVEGQLAAAGLGGRLGSGNRAVRTR